MCVSPIISRVNLWSTTAVILGPPFIYRRSGPESRSRVLAHLYAGGSRCSPLTSSGNCRGKLGLLSFGGFPACSRGAILLSSPVAGATSSPMKPSVQDVRECSSSTRARALTNLSQISTTVFLGYAGTRPASVYKGITSCASLLYQLLGTDWTPALRGFVFEL